LTAALLATTALGCSPYLQTKDATQASYISPVRCGQGPYELHATALGKRWGEGVNLYQSGGRPVSGHAEIWIDGKKVREADVGGGAPQNQACVLSPADTVAGSAIPVNGGGGTTSIPGGYSPAPPPITTSGGPPPTLVKLNGAPSGEWKQLIGWDVSVNDWSEADLALRVGIDIKIVFWSKEVLDLENVSFVIGQTWFEPSSGDDKWVLYLNEKKADREKKAQAAKLEAERQAREEAEEARRREAEIAAEKVKILAEDDRCRALANKNQLDDKCKKAGWRDRNAADEDARCNALALKNATDAQCRSIGWRNDDERPDSRPPSVTGGGRNGSGQPITSWSGNGGTSTGGGSYTPPPAPSPQEPKGPPPPPQIETKTPQPSEHAEWIGGSWKWSGFTWVWLSGGWKVPEIDRVQKRTTTAPVAPPPVQIEARGSPPVSGAVWIDGYWAWTGAWTWVPGRWAIPPQTGASWRPSVWVPEGVSVRLDPGGWIFGR
jgi:hypothetical protein